MESSQNQQNNQVVQQCKDYLENLITASSNIKVGGKGRRQGMVVKQGEGFEQENLDQELLEKAIIEMGEGLSRKNSTMATEEDQDEDDNSDESPDKFQDDGEEEEE